MGTVVLNGATSGSTTLTPTDAVTATLTLPSSTGTLLSTANPQSGGVIQVVSAITNTQTSTNTTTLVDTTLTASITPKFSTSKILVVVDQGGVYSPATAGVRIVLYRNALGLLSFVNYAAYNGSISIDVGSASCNYLDAPATTSSVTYKTQFSNSLGTPGGLVYVQNGSCGSSITLMEIAG